MGVRIPQNWLVGWFSGFWLRLVRFELCVVSLEFCRQRLKLGWSSESDCFSAIIIRA